MQEVFHQYSLIRQLAKKHSHSTYLASPTHEPEHQVILAVFTSSLFSSLRERENLLQKAQRIRQLQNSHLVPILDIGIEDEQPFVVREYLPNASLRSGLKKISPEHLDLQNALTIVLQVGEALTCAHEHDIFHSNIKPENILFDANNQAVLADFSLVSRKDAVIHDQLTEEFAFCYMAPEQFTGTCDARSDQYALGCLTYELITGRIPFASQSLTSMVRRWSNVEPAPLSDSVAGLAPSLETAVLKAMATDPDERFFDFSLFLEVIKSVLSPPPVFPLAHSKRSDKGRSISFPSQEHNESSAPILETVPQSEDPMPELATITPFSEQERDDDWLLTNSSIEKYVNVTVPESSVFGRDEDTRAKMLPALTKRKRVLGSPIMQILPRKRILEVITLGLLAVLALLLTHDFWPVGLPILSKSLQAPRQMRQVVVTRAKITPEVSPSARNTTIPDVPLTYIPTAQLLPIPTPTPTPTPTPRPKVIPTSYEAESSQNTLSGGAQIFSCAGCSGRERVAYLGKQPNGVSGALQFNSINKSIAGSYTMTIYYNEGDSGGRTGYVSVNGGPAITFTGAYTGDWNNVETVNMTISLSAGNNTIEFFNSQQWAPDIDRIVV